MLPVTLHAARFSVCLLLLSTVIGQVQTSEPPKAELKGTVLDVVDESPVPAADVVIRDPAGSSVAHTISNAKGQYSVVGLARGSRVNLSYHCEGYLPYPGGPLQVILAAAQNTKVVPLYRKTDDPDYWGRWSKKIKTAVDALTTNPEKRTKTYDETWSSLGHLGFSAMAQAVAARQLVGVVPSASYSPQLQSFASVDLDQLRQADANIRAAVNGHANLTKYSIPPDVAATIAADELKKKGPETQELPAFRKDFQTTWGRQGNKALEVHLGQQISGAVGWVANSSVEPQQ
jgi:hypothetical protein